MKIHYSNKTLWQKLLFAIFLFGITLIVGKGRGSVYLLPLQVLLSVAGLFILLQLLKNRNSFYFSIEDGKLEFRTLFGKKSFDLDEVKSFEIKGENIVIVEKSGKKNSFSLRNVAESDVLKLRNLLLH